MRHLGIDLHLSSCGPFTILTQRFHRRFMIVVLVIAVVVLTAVWMRFQRTFEGRLWDQLFFAGFALMLTVITFSVLRIYSLWKGLEHLLRLLATLPLHGALESLPYKAHYLASRWLLHRRWRSTDLNILYMLVESLRRKRRESAAPHTKVDDRLGQFVFQIKPQSGNDEAILAERIPQLIALSRELTLESLPTWPGREMVRAYGRDFSEMSKPGASPSSRFDVAEQIIALMIVLFLAPFFDRLRSLCFMLGVAAATLVLAATAYSFQPEGLILSVVAGYSAFVAGFLF